MLSLSGRNGGARRIRSFRGCPKLRAAVKSVEEAMSSPLGLWQKGPSWRVTEITILNLSAGAEENKVGLHRGGVMRLWVGRILEDRYDKYSLCESINA